MIRRLLRRGWSESSASLLCGDVEGRLALLLYVTLGGATVGFAAGFVVGAVWFASQLSRPFP